MVVKIVLCFGGSMKVTCSFAMYTKSNAKGEEDMQEKNCFGRFAVVCSCGRLPLQQTTPRNGEL